MSKYVMLTITDKSCVKCKINATKPRSLLISRWSEHISFKFLDGMYYLNTLWWHGENVLLHGSKAP